MHSILPQKQKPSLPSVPNCEAWILGDWESLSFVDQFWKTGRSLTVFTFCHRHRGGFFEAAQLSEKKLTSVRRSGKSRKLSILSPTTVNSGECLLGTYPVTSMVLGPSRCL